MTVARFTEQEMENWREADRKTPRTRKLFDLAKAHAEQEGGQTLELWKLHMGRLWGIPMMMTIDDAAQRMNISVSRAQQIFDNSIEAIRPEWEASPEFHISWNPDAKLSECRPGSLNVLRRALGTSESRQCRDDPVAATETDSDAERYI